MYRVLFAHDHERGFAFEVHVGLAADVDGYPVVSAPIEVTSQGKLSPKRL
jgi:hypothetical protein